MPHQCTTCGNLFDDGSKEMLGGCPECGGNTFQFHPAGADVPEEPPDEDPPEPDGSTTANTVGRAATKVRDFVSRDTDAPSEPADTDTTEPGSPATGTDTTEPTPTESPPTETRSTEPTPTTGATEAPGSAAAGDGTTAEDGTTSRDTASSPGRATGTDSGGPDPNAAWPSEDDPEEFPSVGDDSDIIDADAREAARNSAEDGAQTAARGELASESEVSAGAEDGLAGAEADVGAGAGDTSGGTGTPDAGEAPSEGRVVSEPSEDQPDIEELREQLNDQFESIKILEPGQYELNLMELYDRDEYIIALQENGRYVIQVPEQWLGDQPGT
jgi:predicted  nucleic acid-binding Zn-ribbon protein